MVLNDFQRGRLPYFVKPPGADLDIQKPSKPTENSSQPLIKFVPAAGETEDSTCATTSEPEASTETEQEAVPTSPQGEAGSLTNKEKRLQMKIARQEKLERRQPRVAQDLSKIIVGLDFSGDDVQPLEPQSPGVVSTMSGYSADQSYVSEDDLGKDDGDEEEEEEEDLQPGEEDIQSDVSSESDDTGVSNQEENTNREEVQKRERSSQLADSEKKKDEFEAGDSEPRDPCKRQKNKPLSTTSSQAKKGNVKDKESLDSQYVLKNPVSKKVRKAMKRKLTQMSTSGKWVASTVSEASASTPVASTSSWNVQSTPGPVESGSMESDKSGLVSSPTGKMSPSETELLQASDDYAVKVNPHVFCVEATPSPSKKSKMTENFGDLEHEQSEKKKNLTAKQRRSLERAQKTKKVGTHYYQEVNVKNKNRNKKRDIGRNTPSKSVKKGRNETVKQEKYNLQ
uniref:Uncharacterized protein n=1 Tax=Branchiostoma floridae TaxID=7739 RepID=C3YQC2_BRAFL|eukprot:XP_002601508.1 hypothetical protein BRAFLDRAFT_105985 [Branchiostoma floridae]